MAFNAGSVYAILGGRFSPEGFLRFEAALKAGGAQAGKFERQFGQSMQRSQSHASRFGQVAKQGATLGVLAIGAAIVSTVKQAATFEQQMSALGATTGATHAQMKKLAAGAMAAGAATKYSALDAAQAQTELAKGGLSAAQILGGGLRASLALAAAGELALADAASYTANAMNLFGLQGKAAAHIADEFATAANTTTADVKDFGAALVQGGAVAKSAGYSFTQTMVILEALAKSGVKNADAGTSMKTALIQLIKPTKHQAEAAKAAGLSFINQNGSMKDAIQISAMLRSHTEKLTKVERTKLFATLAGTDGVRTLNAIYAAGPATLGRYSAALEKTGTAARVAAEKQANFAGRFENFKGSIQTLAITIGTALLPMLSQLATRATNAINAFMKGGGAARIGHLIAEGFQKAAAIVDTFAGYAKTAAGAIIGLGQAMDIGDPAKLKALVTALIGLKIASVVVGPITALVAIIGELAAAFTLADAGVVGFAGIMATSLNPVAVAAVAISGLAAGLVYLSSQESGEARSARESAAAKRDQAKAVRDLHDATYAASDAKFASLDAQQQYRTARTDRNRAIKKFGLGSTEGQAADLTFREANARRWQAADAATQASANVTTKATQTIVSGISEQAKAYNALRLAKDKVENMTKRGAGGIRAGSVDPGALAKARGDVVRLGAAYKASMVDAASGVASLSLNAVNFDRLQKSMQPFGDKQAASVQKFQAAIQGLPKSVRSKLELAGTPKTIGDLATVASMLAGLGKAKAIPKLAADDAAAKGKISSVAAQLIDLGHASAVVRILGNNDDAKQKVAELNGVLRSIPNPTVHINLLYNQPSTPTLPGFNLGPTPKPPKRGRVIASGAKTHGPEVALIGEGRGPEYVIPTEPAYRGRGIGLWMQAGRDLGIPGYKAGVRYSSGGIDPAVAQTKVDAAQNALDADVQKIQTEQSNIKSGSVKQKAAAKGRLAADRRRLPGLKRALHQAKQNLAAAKSYEDKITAQGDEAGISTSNMDIADANHDGAGFDAAKRSALNQIDAAISETNTTLAKRVKGRLVVQPGSVRGRELRKRLADLTIQRQQTNDRKLTVTPAQFDLNALLDAADPNLRANLALAGTTDTPADDIKSLGDEQRIVAAALAAERAGPNRTDFVIGLANELQNVNSSITSLATAGGSGSSGPTADQSAILAQTQAQRDAARADVRSQSAFFGALAGGSGGAEVGNTTNIYTLHPGDPRTLSAIGSAATQGQFQSSGPVSPYAPMPV